jgi:hypothetical protein
MFCCWVCLTYPYGVLTRRCMLASAHRGLQSPSHTQCQRTWVQQAGGGWVGRRGMGVAAGVGRGMGMMCENGMMGYGKGVRDMGWGVTGCEVKGATRRYLWHALPCFASKGGPPRRRCGNSSWQLVAAAAFHPISIHPSKRSPTCTVTGAPCVEHRTTRRSAIRASRAVNNELVTTQTLLYSMSLRSP